MILRRAASCLDHEGIDEMKFLEQAGQFPTQIVPSAKPDRQRFHWAPHPRCVDQPEAGIRSLPVLSPPCPHSRKQDASSKEGVGLLPAK